LYCALIASRGYVPVVAGRVPLKFNVTATSLSKPSPKSKSLMHKLLVMVDSSLMFIVASVVRVTPKKKVGNKKMIKEQNRQFQF